MHRRIPRILTATIALFAMALSAPVWAWWDYGHKTVAQIALANINPKTRAEIIRLVRVQAQLGTPQCPIHNLDDASVWPDCLRSDSQRWAYTFPWHYQTHDICKPFDPNGDCANGNCISAQIDRSMRLLSDKSLPVHIRLEALAFVAHLVGDIHMPLHSGDHEDQGGNKVKANYGAMPGYNLHSVWDGLLAERSISDGPNLVRRYSAQEKAELAGGTVADWGRESWEASRNFAYKTALGGDPCSLPAPDKPVTIDEQDVAATKDVLRERIERGGLRLARLLDQALGH